MDEAHLIAAVRYVALNPVRARVERFAELIETADDPAALAAIRAAELTGRPLGNADFVAGLER